MIFAIHPVPHDFHYKTRGKLRFFKTIMRNIMPDSRISMSKKSVKHEGKAQFTICLLFLASTQNRAKKPQVFTKDCKIRGKLPNASSCRVPLSENTHEVRQLSWHLPKILDKTSVFDTPCLLSLGSSLHQFQGPGAAKYCKYRGKRMFCTAYILHGKIRENRTIGHNSLVFATNLWLSVFACFYTSLE